MNTQFALSIENVQKVIKENLGWVIAGGGDGLEFLENIRRYIDNTILAAQLDPSVMQKKKSSTRQGSGKRK